MRTAALAILAGLFALPGCGTFTGIPTHGGGKRFAVEQELIAASSRAVAKAIDVSPLVGKKCSLNVITIGDEGSGNLVGGRYSWEAAIRGDYVNTPTTRSSFDFPVIPTTATTTTNTGFTSTTIAQNAINAPSRSRTRTEGADARMGGGVGYQGPPSYQQEAFINPRDAIFLQGVINEAFALRGVFIVPPERADVDVFITVDIFGTHRSRTEMHLYNRESLIAKTAVEVTAFDRESRRVILPPVTASYEAEYAEEYVLWMGPFRKSKGVRRSSDLLVDFKSLVETTGAESKEKLGAMPVPPDTGVEKSRTKELTAPLAAPETFRPEDVEKQLEGKPPKK